MSTIATGESIKHGTLEMYILHIESYFEAVLDLTLGLQNIQNNNLQIKMMLCLYLVYKYVSLMYAYLEELQFAKFYIHQNANGIVVIL
jgi:hypothetical protein